MLRISNLFTRVLPHRFTNPARGDINLRTWFGRP